MWINEEKKNVIIPEYVIYTVFCMKDATGTASASIFLP